MRIALEAVFFYPFSVASKIALLVLGLAFGFAGGWLLRPLTSPAEPKIAGHATPSDRKIEQLTHENRALQKQLRKLEALVRQPQAAPAVDQTSNQLGTQSPRGQEEVKTSAGIPNLDGVVEFAQQAALSQQRQRADRLIRELHLDSRQTAAVQSCLDAVKSSTNMEELGQASREFEKILRAQLNDDQAAALENFLNQEQDAAAEMLAHAEFMQLRQITGLGPEQEDGAFAALASVIERQMNPEEMGQWNVVADGAAGASPEQIMQRMNQMKLDALTPVLTPEQRSAYEQSLEEQKQMIQHFLP